MYAAVSVRSMNEALLKRADPVRARRGLDRALIVAARQLQRSMLAHHLRQIGVLEIRYASRPSEARRYLETHHHDLIILDEDTSAKRQERAQDLIDDLRRCGLLEINTIVIITASAATYSQVSEAAESGIDSYLLHPFALAHLEQRVQAAVARREAMAEVYAALKVKDYEAALEACLARYAQRDAFWLYAARIAAEIYIMRGQAQQAQALYQAIVEQEALPWAKLGVGRAMLEQGKHDSAAQYLDEVVKEHPEQTDAYDLMGRAYLEAGQHDKALEVYRLAVKATPSSVSRLQRLAFALYYAGQTEEALELLRRSVSIGLRSKSFDLQALAVLAFEAARAHQPKALHEVQQRLQQCLESGAHEAARLQRLQAVVTALEYVALTDWSAAQRALFEMLPQAEQEDLDFDAACNLIQLCALLSASGHGHEMLDQVVQKLGLRFAHSRLASAWLARSAEQHEPYRAVLQDAHEQAFRQAQSILQHAVKGQAERAVTDLIELARSTLNARIIEMAERALERYGAQISSAATLRQRIAAIKQRHDPVQLKRNPSSRQLRHPGGISLLHKL